MPQQIDYHAIAPELFVTGTLLLVVLVDIFTKREHKWFAMPVAMLGTLGALIAGLTLIGDERVTFGGSFVVDDFALLFKVFFLVVALVVLALSLRYFREGRFYQGEYYLLLLTAFLGCLTMASSRDLLMLFISLELVSAPGFLIAAFRRRDPRSNEAGLKFFLIGVLSSAVMLYGMSLIYGLTGSTRLDGIAQGLAGLDGPKETLSLAAILFVVAGFAFKVSSVPFHFWAPDTYEGAPIPVAAFLSVASKAAGFAGLLVLMFQGFGPRADFWAPVFAVLSALTMTVGNLIALQQRQVVRLLAYSSIAQAGYMLLPFALADAGGGIPQDAFASVVLYILIYGVMTLGAFAVVIGLSREAPGMLISDMAGLGKRAPLLAVPMVLFLVSLGGIPPTAGFFAKLAIFEVAIDAGGVGVTLAIIMVVNSVISLAYYLGVARQMIFVDTEARRPRVGALAGGVAVLAAVAVFVLGIYPHLFTQFPAEATLLSP